MTSPVVQPRADMEGILQMMHKYSREQVGEGQIDRGTRGAMIGIMNMLCGSNEMRHKLLYRLFPAKWGYLGAVTTKKLEPSEWYALWKWIQPYKDKKEDGGDGKWKGHAALRLEIENIMGWPIEIHEAKIKS